MRRPKTEPKARRSRGARRAVDDAARSGVEDRFGVTTDATGEALFDRLREWRRATAATRGVPPYVIFHDATLRAIAQRRPASLDELSGVSGVGEKKLDAYGAELIGLIGSTGP
ncbi:MAG: ATP-dependent DNA helicase RecQ, partial [Burkholderiales bacterium]